MWRRFGTGCWSSPDPLVVERDLTLRIYNNRISEYLVYGNSAFWPDGRILGCEFPVRNRNGLDRGLENSKISPTAKPSSTRLQDYEIRAENSSKKMDLPEYILQSLVLVCVVGGFGVIFLRFGWYLCALHFFQFLSA